MTNKRLFLMTVALATLLLSAACTPSDRTMRDSAAGTLDLVPDTRVTDVTLGRGIDSNKKVLDEMDVFTPRDTIYASVRTRGTDSSATLIAQWIFDDSVTVQEQKQLIAPARDTIMEFHVAKATPWPKGKYMLKVFLNGKEVETEGFTIK